jgi:tetratricopeptide (TPR) repeat protein
MLPARPNSGASAGQCHADTTLFSPGGRGVGGEGASVRPGMTIVRKVIHRFRRFSQMSTADSNLRKSGQSADIPSAALAEYRAGRFDSAAEWCRLSLLVAQADEQRASARYLLAMARYRQEEFEKARETLAQAVAATPDFDRFRGNAGTWHDWLVVYTLRREAELLITPKEPYQKTD